MKCYNCGAEVQENDRFCTLCGSRVEQPPVVTQPPVNEVAPPTNSTNSIWPEWQIEKQLGRGSYGVVYQAVRRDNNVESYSAIKVISIPSDSSEVDSLRSEGLDLNGTKTYFQGIVEDFVREIQLMESLKGIQNIVSVEDYKVIEKTDTIGWDIYIRMELLVPFNTYICDKVLTEEEVIKLGCDICTALEICGQRNIIHRDIKPENIFINDFGYFKLGDFGIARKLENMTGGLSQKGTYNYMAPEVAVGNEYDSRVDTYSLGIVLYRLLNNNRLPFLDSDKQLLSPNERKTAVDRRMRGEALVPPCNASPAMADLILRACAYDRNLRFASASEMKQALISVANGTYVMPNTDLDKTAFARPAEVNYDATMSVRKATEAPVYNSQPVVNSFGDKPKKKKEKKEKKKGKKAKIIAISVLSGLLALAIALTIIFFTSSAYGVYKDVESGDYAEALAGYHSDVEDSFIQEFILDMLLDGRAEDVASEYNSGAIKYSSAAAELKALNEMDYSDAEGKLQEVMASYAEKTVTGYENEEIDFESAISALNTVKADGYTEADSLIEQITVSNDADNALEQANEYYENGDYENAISEYSKIPESNENYEEAQNKLNAVYEDYINSIIESANKYNSKKEYKQAVQIINTAYSVLPDSMDTAELDTVKEESLASYKTEVANEVAELTADSKWTEAFEIVNNAISFDDNEYFQSLKTSTEDKYVNSVSSTVQNYLNNEDYVSAKRVVENALTILPDNSSLESLQKKVENSTPTYLVDVCSAYESNYYTKYSKGETFAMGGKSYTNGFTLREDYGNSYAIFNVDKQYSSLSFLTGHVDKTHMYSVTLKIYCDGILKKEQTIKADALPQKITIDITGVNQLKIVIESSNDDAIYGFANVTVK